MKLRFSGLFHLLPVAILVSAMGVRAASAAPVPKVTICHFPPGNPANVQVITVGAPAVPAHLTQHNDAVCAAGDSDCCFGGTAPSVCTNFASDVNNCGGCGVVCDLPNAVPACTDGVCTVSSCNAGFADCDSDPTNGCETDTNTDTNNCGTCGNVCPAGQTCTAGTCEVVCAPGTTLCNGVCVDTNTDPNNCGSCGNTCATGQVCTGGTCTTNPSPECEGQTCSTFTTCNASACGGAGVCGSTAEGGGFCVNGATPCAGLPGCTTSADCAAGSICVVDSCCVTGVCMNSSQFCQ